MKQPGPKKKKTITCPRCNAPAPAGTPFCEACGARISPPPACTLCGTLLEPGSRFCPSCGTMIGNSPDNPPDVPGAPPEAPPAEKKPRPPVRAKKAKSPAPAKEKPPDPLMMIPEEDDGMELSSDAEEPVPPVPEPPTRKSVPPAASLATTPPPGRPGRFTLPLNRTTGAAAGIILIFVATIFVFTGILSIPAFSSSAGSTPASATAVPTTAPVVAETPAAPVALTPAPVAAVTTARTISLTPGPTQVPPDIFDVSFEAERDPRTKIVSVQFMGGKGQYGVRDVFVRLTRSDGQVLTGTFKPVQVGSGIELQGTEKTDRVEVIVNYHTGDVYTVIDKQFEYKIRSL